MKEHTRNLLDKAHHAIHAAEILLREGEMDSAAGRAYYAMFYVASALLAEHGLRASKHSGVHALFGEHFVKSGRIDAKFHRFLLDAFDRRLHADYSFETAITEAEVITMIAETREFMARVQSLLPS